MAGVGFTCHDCGRTGLAAAQFSMLRDACLECIDRTAGAFAVTGVDRERFRAWLAAQAESVRGMRTPLTPDLEDAAVRKWLIREGAEVSSATDVHPAACEVCRMLAGAVAHLEAARARHLKSAVSPAAGDPCGICGRPYNSDEIHAHINRPPGLVSGRRVLEVISRVEVQGAQLALRSVLAKSPDECVEAALDAGASRALAPPRQHEAIGVWVLYAELPAETVAGKHGPGIVIERGPGKFRAACEALGFEVPNA